MLMKVFAKPYTASSLIVMARKQRTKSRDFFNLKKSRILLLMLLAMIVGGVSLSFAQQYTK